MTKKLNNRLLFILIIFMLISILLINSSMSFSTVDNLTIKQLIWYVTSFFLIFIIKHIKTYKYAYLGIYLFNLLLLLIVLLYGDIINGSRCWLTIPKIGSFQPSEFMKVSLILLTSQVVDNYYKSHIITFMNEIKLLLLILLIFIPPTLLTFLEPDTGAIIIYFLIAISILLLSPLRKRWWIIISVIIIIIIASLIYLFLYNKTLFINIFSEDIFYRINRILDWKSKSGMQLENSLIAIGSAGLFGHGYMKTPIYFPESSNDFIFAHLVSNFGLIITLLFIILLIMFDLTLLKFSNTENNTKKYITISTLIIILFSQVQNIGMTIGLLPIIGIPLPFISYGGSSLLSYSILIGIIGKIK